MKLKLIAAVLLIAIALGASWFLVERRRGPSNTNPGANARATSATVVLDSIGPRLVSNDTTQPLAIYGSGFAPGMSLQLGAPLNRTLPLSVVDAKHAYARLPADLHLPADQMQLEVPIAVVDLQGAPTRTISLTLVNDAAFVDPTAVALSPDGSMQFSLSTTTDELIVTRDRSAGPEKISVGDGPTAMAPYVDASGTSWLAVVHRYAPELRLYDIANLSAPPRVIPAPANASGLVVDDRGIAYVTEQARDTVVAINLANGQQLWRTPVDPNPRELAVAGDWLVVGSLQAGTVNVLDRASGRETKRIAPTNETSIVGGGTAKYARYIMGGKAPRAFAWSPRLQRLFVASIGPNIGPNPDRMEVSMNGGVGVIDLASGKFVRHLGFGAGITQALALDDEKGLLYAADIGLGIVRVVDAAKLASSDDGAAHALIREIRIPPPEGFPTLRPTGDFGVNRRAGVELHSGPNALALTKDGATLFALCRFTGMLARIDAWGGTVAQKQLANTLGQQTRRLGEILYFTDLGRSAMSCDACHLEGHTEGVFFAKTHPLRIYRSPTVRGSRESPPYFTPASTRSLAETAQVVGGRNRYHNPDPTTQEIEALALYTSEITPLPNPFVGADGAPVESLTLPDGRAGHPRRGIALFEAHCESCHPAPHFTLDQSPATRGQYLDVGTPHAMSLRVDQQELTFTRFGTPALVGAWDVFPMLGTGSAGFSVGDDAQLHVSTRFPLRELLEKFSGPKHGNAQALTPEERDDLLAFLMSL